MMSEVATPKSHLLSWGLVVLAALLLYVASRPVVELETSSSHLSDSSMVRTPVQWVAALYEPVDFLRYLNGGDNPGAAYDAWGADIILKTQRQKLLHELRAHP